MIENALASAFSVAMLEHSVDAVLDRVARMGVLSEKEIAKLRADIVERLRSIEREGREVRQAMEGFVETLLARIAHRPGHRSSENPLASPPGDPDENSGEPPVEETIRDR